MEDGDGEAAIELPMADRIGRGGCCLVARGIGYTRVAAQVEDQVGKG